TTRLLTTAILGKSSLDLFEIFSFENYYNQNITRYFKAVGLTGDYYDHKDNVDFTHWLEYFADLPWATFSKGWCPQERPHGRRRVKKTDWWLTLRQCRLGFFHQFGKSCRLVNG
ncbi:MAG: hypothetical protein L3J04_08620, partial [Robiginitomaculum sp.]|nr:hypothetical protein [Robiginitomaculum sp.]